MACSNEFTSQSHFSVVLKFSRKQEVIITLLSVITKIYFMTVSVVCMTESYIQLSLAQISRQSAAHDKGNKNVNNV